MNVDFSIAGIPIQLQTAHPLKITPGFHEFFQEAPKVENPCECIFREVEKLPEKPEEECLYKELLFEVYRAGENHFQRFYYDGRDVGKGPYACRVSDEESRKIYVNYLPWGAKFVNETQNAFYHVALEEVMLWEKRFILHASLVQTCCGGIVFTGPSGIGKSTQADLWVQYENARILNGDRTILYKEGEKWYGCGSPYAGSSRYYLNERTEIAAIVVLKQSTENKVGRLKEKDSFRKLLEGLTVNSWNPSFMEKICDELETLIQDVPVYQLECTADKNAVSSLKNRLMKGR